MFLCSGQTVKSNLVEIILFFLATLFALLNFSKELENVYIYNKVSFQSRAKTASKMIGLCTMATKL